LGFERAPAFKNDNWTAIYYEEILDSNRNKALRGITIYKKTGTVNKDSFLKLISNNAHINISEIKMVVGAGGHPDGEA
jgi:LysM repeat protein